MTPHVHAKRKLVLSEVVCYGGAFNVKACPITKIMPSSTHRHCIARPSCAQEAPKRLHVCSQSPILKKSYMAQAGPFSRWRPRDPNMASRCCQSGPSWRQDGTKVRQDGVKVAQLGAKVHQDGADKQGSEARRAKWGSLLSLTRTMTQQ